MEPGVQTIIVILALGAFITAAFVDVRRRRIPNALSYMVGSLGLLRILLAGDPAAAGCTLAAAAGALAIGFMFFWGGTFGCGYDHIGAANLRFEVSSNAVSKKLPMRAKTILALLFLVSIGVAATVVLRSLPQNLEAAPEAAAREEILVATMPLAPGTLLRAPDVTWQMIGRAAERGEIVRPSATVREA